MLGTEFPESQHVVELGLDTASDYEVWLFARDQGFVIASKDSDFRQLAFLNGRPPKVIWVRTGNVTTAAIADPLRINRARIEAFVAAPEEALLGLPLTAIEGSA